VFSRYTDFIYELKYNSFDNFVILAVTDIVKFEPEWKC
jgi:hypothetical protein